MVAFLLIALEIFGNYGQDQVRLADSKEKLPAILDGDTLEAFQIVWSYERPKVLHAVCNKLSDYHFMFERIDGRIKVTMNPVRYPKDKLYNLPWEYADWVVDYVDMKKKKVVLSNPDDM